MRSLLALAAAMVVLVACRGSTTSKGSSLPSTIVEPPAAFSRGLRCSLRADNGAPYYVQLPASSKSDAMCAGSKQRYTSEEFHAIPGLTQQCAFDSAKEIANNNGVVEIYSDETPESIDAARMICGNAGH